MIEDTKFPISKLDAAKRHLKSALELWFAEGDPISIHTLIVAAYDIIHTVSRRKGAYDLIYDSDMIKDEYRREWASSVKSHANFFKHADHDPDEIIQFSPFENEFFFLYCAKALYQTGELLSVELRAYLTWLEIFRPKFIKEHAIGRIPIEVVNHAKNVSRQEFLNLIRLGQIATAPP
jgi:hypothetical protein